ncbi:hypothetical protein JW758_01080 [Candidatus Peregrinibacteria bacterium]|nr:hypothetical protein [Candidatus Peregrinibacteria bacterium]
MSGKKEETGRGHTYLIRGATPDPQTAMEQNIRNMTPPKDRPENQPQKRR